MPNDLIRYDLLVQDALRSVVRKVLGDAARHGLPGDHHFNIAFKTQAPGVVIPSAVRQRYPDEMSIILQHEFWDLSVTPETFEVSVNFSRKPERLVVPFDAITGFNDPSVPFGFKLEPRQPSASESVNPALDKPALDKPATAAVPAVLAKPEGRPADRPKAPLRAAPRPAETAAAKPADSKPGDSKAPAAKSDEKTEAKVVSIDAFRKK
jgi:hypothetical protein